MSKNYVNLNFVAWTDTSSKETKEGVLTVTGAVIKDGGFPPLCISSAHYNMKTSAGELIAGIECLETLITYCEYFGLDTKYCGVELKTDSNELNRTINNGVKKNSKNLELLTILEKLKKRFKKVKSEEICRMNNIAHNICYLKMKEENGEENGKNNGVANFYEYYENPKLCKGKNTKPKLIFC